MNFNISPDWLQRTWTTHSWPVSNYQHQNGIAPSLQLRKHAAGAHDDQIATNPARTNNNQDGVRTFYQCQPVGIGFTKNAHLFYSFKSHRFIEQKFQSKSKHIIFWVSDPEDHCSKKHSWNIWCMDLFQLIKEPSKWG